MTTSYMIKRAIHENFRQPQYFVCYRKSEFGILLLTNIGHLIHSTEFKL